MEKNVFQSIRNLGIEAQRKYKKEIVGNHLYKFMNEKGISRKEFEEMINKKDFELIISTNHNSVNQWISGEKQIPTDKLYIFAKMFDRSVDDFFKTTKKYDEYRVNERVEVIQPAVKIYQDKVFAVIFHFFTEEYESISMVGPIPTGFISKLKSKKEVWFEPDDFERINGRADFKNLDTDTVLVAETDNAEDGADPVLKEYRRFFATPSDKLVYPYVGRICALEGIKYLIAQQEQFNEKKKTDLHQENIANLKKLYEILSSPSYSFGYPATQVKTEKKLKEDYPELF